MTSTNNQVEAITSSEDRTKKMIDMAKRGKYFEEIGNEFGISKQRVQQILAKNGYSLKMFQSARKIGNYQYSWDELNKLLKGHEKDYLQGKISRKELSEKYSISQYLVYRYFRKNNVSLKNRRSEISKKRFEKMLKMAKEGKRASDIAKEFNTSAPILYALFLQKGYSFRKDFNPRIKNKRFEKMLDIAKEGKNISYIAKKFNVSIMTVYKIFKKEGYNIEKDFNQYRINRPEV